MFYVIYRLKKIQLYTRDEFCVPQNTYHAAIQLAEMNLKPQYLITEY